MTTATTTNNTDPVSKIIDHPRYAGFFQLNEQTSSIRAYVVVFVTRTSAMAWGLYYCKLSKYEPARQAFQKCGESLVLVAKQIKEQKKNLDKRDEQNLAGKILQIGVTSV